MPEIRIRMFKDVIPFYPFRSSGTVLRAGKEYSAESNPNGAISGICANGELLGVKPGEFEFIEAPEWVLKKWRTEQTP